MVKSCTHSPATLPTREGGIALWMHTVELCHERPPDMPVSAHLAPPLRHAAR
jgi:hypothetical protein